MVSRKALDISVDDNHTPLLTTARGEHATPSQKGKFHLKLSPASQSMMLTKGQLKTERSSTETLRSHRLISPRLPPLKSIPAGRDRQGLGARKFRTVGGAQTERDEDDEEERKMYMERLMRRTNREELQVIDEKPKETVGQKALNDYYSHFKKLDKVKDQNIFREVKDSMFTSFLSKGDELNMFPSKIGFIKEKGSNSSIEISHFLIGDKYAEILGEGLKNNARVHQFSLGNNRLTPKGAEFILSKISRTATLIDLSNNSIGRIGCEYLVRILEAKNSNLQVLNLEGNKLGDYSIMLLCDAIQNNHELRLLNIAKNFLTNGCTEKLGSTLEKNDSIKELYLYWNQIQGGGGNNILKGMMNNKNLKILDFAWNSLGLNPSGFSKLFADYIAVNTELIILNLSNNSFSKQDSKIIAEGLEKNHTLYEFQFQGNPGYVDCLGFLVVNDHSEVDIASQYVASHTSGKYPNPDLIKRYDSVNEEVRDGAWISEGWRPVTFNWRPGVSGDAKHDPVFLHLIHMGNQAIWLPSHKKFSIQLMCPPTTIQYFFTADDEQVIAENQPQDAARDALFHGTLYGKPFTTKLSKVNVHENQIDMQILDSNLEVNCLLKPRIRPEVYLAPEIEKEKIAWTFPVSIFKDYRADTDELLKKCFEVDFETSRIHKVVKKPEELEKVKTLLFNAYKKLKGAYKFLSCISASGDVWAIGTNVFTDFLSKCNMIDDTLRLKDADLKFIATYTKTDPAMMKNPRNPDRMLVRYQFLEIWVRLADQKFIGNNIVHNFPEAVEKVLNEHVIPYVNGNDSYFAPHKWREERYWNEDVDTVYKSYLPIASAIYKKYSGMKTKPGMKKFTCIEELQNIATDAAILNDNLVDRDIVIAFNLSMMTQLDELNSDRIFQMSFVEFLEAIARIADVYSAASPGEEETTAGLEQRKTRPLHYKLEGFLHILYHRVCDNLTKDSYIMPERSIFEEPNTGAIMPLPKKNTRKKILIRLDPVAYYYANNATLSRIDI